MLRISEIAKIQDKVNKIISAQKMIDDHEHKNTPTEYNWEPKYIGLHKHGDEIVPVYVTDNPEARYFSVNEIYTDRAGRVHISDRSVGGVVNLSASKNFEDAVRKYNEEHLNLPKMHLTILDCRNREAKIYIA